MDEYTFIAIFWIVAGLIMIAMFTDFRNIKDRLSLYFKGKYNCQYCDELTSEMNKIIIQTGSCSETDHEVIYLICNKCKEKHDNEA